MRFLLAALALASATGGAAQSGADLPLLPGEVLLEAEADGRSVARPHTARLVVSLTGVGATRAEARRNVEEQAARLRSAARSVGVAPADVTPMRSVSRVGFVAGAPEEFEAPVGVMPPGTATERHALRTFEIRVRDPGGAERIRQALEESGEGAVSAPIYEPADSDAERRSARADALRRARADAEALAAAAGMRVARIVRISERARDVSLNVLVRAYGGDQPTVRQDGVVETTAHLSVDFALAPR